MFLGQAKVCCTLSVRIKYNLMKKRNITRILDYYMSQDNLWMFRADVERALEEFFDGKPDWPPPIEAAGHFNEWFLYDFHLSDGETPLEYFYDKNPLSLPLEELAVYKDIQENIYDIWEVKEVRENEGLSLMSVRSGKRYEIQEKTATRELKKDDVFACRVIKIGDHYELAGGSSFMLPRMNRGAKKFLKGTTDKIDPKSMLNAFAAKPPEANFKKDKIADSDTVLISGGYGGALTEEDDNCAVCRLMRKAREDGRQPTEKEIKRAIKEAEQNGGRASANGPDC